MQQNALNVNCNVKKVQFYIDEVEEIGSINLDQAIEIFQSFPFDDQLKQAQKDEFTHSLPTVTFISDKGSIINIWCESQDGFFLHYENEKNIADFYLSNNVLENPEGQSVEEFIKHFFNQTIEQKLILREKLVLSNENDLHVEYKKKSNQDMEEFAYSDPRKYKFYLWTIPWLLIALVLFRVDAINNFIMGWKVHLLMSLFWLPSTIIHLSYWIKNRGVIVTINSKTKTLSYKKAGQTIEFGRNEIHNCEINETRSNRPPWKSYRYIWFVLTDKRQIVITNFVTEPDNIIRLLQPRFKVEKRIVPFLPI